MNAFTKHIERKQAVSKAFAALMVVLCSSLVVGGLFWLGGHIGGRW